MSVTKSLDEILAQLGREGPVTARLSPAAYALLKEKAARMWRGLRNGRYSGWVRWNEEEKLAFLGFLRGYTLYREVPENERQFWAHFHRELGLKAGAQVRQAQYDALWDALSSHPETRPHLVVTNGRRLFVQTIDRIWGVRGLQARVFANLCRMYLKDHAGRVVDAKLLKELDPTLPEGVLHQAPTYDRILRGLVRAFEALKETPELAAAYLEGKASEADLDAYLRKCGLIFSQPNPLMFLRHKSEATLRQLLQEALDARKPGRTVAAQDEQRSRGRADPVEVSFERIENPEDLELQIIPNVEEAVLAEGVYVTGEVQLMDGRWARFQWCPRCSPDGEAEWSRPEPSPIEVGNVRLAFSLKAPEAAAVRLRDARTRQPLEVLRSWGDDRIEVLPVGRARNRPLYFSLRSRPVARVQRLEELVPRPEDELLIEYDAGHQHFVLLGRYPVRLEPRILDLRAVREGRDPRRDAP